MCRKGLDFGATPWRMGARGSRVSGCGCARPLALGERYGHLSHMFRHLRRFVNFLPLAATVTLACSTPVASKPPAVRSGDPALWVVSDADTTIYLFGSVHMLKPDAVWFDDEVRAAFERSDTLVLEVAEEDPAKLAAVIAPMAANTSGEPT